jgi:hypothetical protein
VWLSQVNLHREFTLEERKAMKRVWLTMGFLIVWLSLSVPASARHARYQLAPRPEDQPSREEQPGKAEQARREDQSGREEQPSKAGQLRSEDQARREDQQEQRKYPTSVDVQVGSERITVSGAQGFVEPTKVFPSLREFAERKFAPASHLLAVFLLEKSLPGSDKGEVGDLSRYILVETERSYEEKNQSISNFSRTKMELKTLAGDSMQKSFADVKASLKKIDPVLDPAGVEKSGWVDEGDRYITFGRLARSTDASGSRVVVSVGTTVLVKAKALSFLVFAPFTSYEDVVWAEGVSKELIANVLRDNQ